MHAWMTDLFPESRSLVGPGIDDAMHYLAQRIPFDVTFLRFPSGSRVGDWVVPDSWELIEGSIRDRRGEVVVTSADTNLHVWSHSDPVEAEMTAKQLKPHLLTHPTIPNAVPYATVYYGGGWGFSVNHQQADRMAQGSFSVKIDAKKKPGHLSVMEVRVPGETEEEIFFSTYLCHPSMANNELSGPVLAVGILRWLASRRNRYSYRFVFAPETLGAVCYLQQELASLRSRVWSAWNLTCVGDERTWSFLPSPSGETLTDRHARWQLAHAGIKYAEYSYLDRGSDERQYTSPLVNLPMASVMRSKYHEYPEYHTNLDDLRLVTAVGLQQSLDFYKRLITGLDREGVHWSTSVGEPFLSRYVAYPHVGGRADSRQTLPFRIYWNVIALCSGKTSLGIAEALDIDLETAQQVLSDCVGWGLVSRSPVAPGGDTRDR